MYIDMSKLECNVNPEGKGFLAYVDLGKDENGKRIRPRARGRSEDEAVAKLEKKIRERYHVQQIEEAPKLDMIINQFTCIPDFVREYRVNIIMERIKDKDNKSRPITSRSAENYFYMLKHFEDYFRLVTVGDITVNALNQFFESEKEKFSLSTVQKVECLVRQMFIRAKKRKWISNNPFEDEEYNKLDLKTSTGKIDGLTPEELVEFLGIIKEYPIIYNPIILMLNTGMRTQEVIGLKWGDVDFQNDRLFIRRAVTMAIEFDEDGKIKSRKSIIGDTKTESSNREIGLTAEAKEILLKWREEAPRISMTKLGDDDFVFGYEKKPSFTYCAFRDKVNKYLTRQAGSIDRMRLHRFRHTVATLLVAEGREVNQIMLQLGITQEKTLQRYIDKKGNRKIIDGNVNAISKGLSDILNPSKQISVDDEAIQIILNLNAAGKLSDSNTKAVIMAMIGAVQRV